MKKIPHEPKLDVRVKGIPVDRLDEFLGMLETGNFTESLTQALKTRISGGSWLFVRRIATFIAREN